MTNAEPEAGVLHASVNLKQTSAYADMNRIWIKCVFSRASNLFHPANQRSVLCAGVLTILPQNPRNSFCSLMLAQKTRIYPLD